MFLSGITDLFTSSLTLGGGQSCFQVTAKMSPDGCPGGGRGAMSRLLIGMLVYCTAPFPWVLPCPPPCSAFLVLWLVICGSSACDWVSCNLSSLLSQELSFLAVPRLLHR